MRALRHRHNRSPIHRRGAGQTPLATVLFRLALRPLSLELIVKLAIREIQAWRTPLMYWSSCSWAQVAISTVTNTNPKRREQLAKPKQGPNDAASPTGRRRGASGGSGSQQSRPSQSLGSDAAEGVGGTFPIVGIGMSAGGLEVATAFLNAMPADSGMGFVIVQHLDPTRESMLADLLRRETAKPASAISSGYD